MAKQGPAQKAKVKAKVADVMGEFKDGKLRSSSGQKVIDPKQAIAIALHEAGVSREQRPGTSRAELYAEVKARGIKGRARMTREQLARALA